MADFADSLEDATEKQKSEKKRHDDNKKIALSHVAGFFHPSNTHHHDYPRELDFLATHLQRCGVSLNLNISNNTKSQPTASDFNLTLPKYDYPFALHSVISASSAATPSKPSVSIDIYPWRTCQYTNTTVKAEFVFEQIFVLPERVITSYDDLHVGKEEPIPRFNAKESNKARTTSQNKIRPEYVKSEWLHTNGARALKKEHFRVKSTDIWLYTTHHLYARKMQPHFMWWRIIIETEPSSEILSDDDKGDDEIENDIQAEEVCTSIRVRAYLLNYSALEALSKMQVKKVFSQPKPSVYQPLDHKVEDDRNERAVGKIEEIHKRHAEKEEKKRERRKNEKKKTIQPKKDHEDCFD
eukprot:TRINITY_DN16391_c0_g1_i1.p1 TRINITY_DN16391_c0_g1~~TRINITY_DN16391_c0_g1_i1.p1  ORF type:complete len:377 (-),score=104.41 TRINITY_DN16391_c0_g1_i1:28-1089(-)